MEETLKQKSEESAADCLRILLRMISINEYPESKERVDVLKLAPRFLEDIEKLQCSLHEETAQLAKSFIETAKN